MINKILTYIDSQWIKEQIWYMMSSKGRESKKVSKFIKDQLANSRLEDIVKDNRWRFIKDKDTRMLKIMTWVNDNILYISDIKQYKSVEYWATVHETLESMAGDCEDGAILMYCLARTARIPVSQLKIVAGDVRKSPFNKLDRDLTGHCWVRYVSEKYPYNAFYHDWCYLTDFRSVHNREVYIDFRKPIRPLNSNYVNIWFLTDEDKSTKGFKHD